MVLSTRYGPCELTWLETEDCFQTSVVNLACCIVRSILGTWLYVDVESIFHCMTFTTLGNESLSRFIHRASIEKNRV